MTPQNSGISSRGMRGRLLPEGRCNQAGPTAAVWQSSEHPSSSDLAELEWERSLCLTEKPLWEKRGLEPTSLSPARLGRRWLFNGGTAFSHLSVLFQLNELQKKQHEANFAVAPLKVICL